MSGFIIEGKNRKPVSRETDSGQKVLTIDSKGRISIPADIRRSLGLASGDRIFLDFDLEEGIIILERRCQEALSFQGDGQNGVDGSTKGCESSSPGSKRSPTACINGSKPSIENPGSGPEKKGGKNG